MLKIIRAVSLFLGMYVINTDLVKPIYWSTDPSLSLSFVTKHFMLLWLTLRQTLFFFFFYKLHNYICAAHVHAKQMWIMTICWSCSPHFCLTMRWKAEDNYTPVIWEIWTNPPTSDTLLNIDRQYERGRTDTRQISLEPHENWANYDSLTGI